MREIRTFDDLIGNKRLITYMKESAVSWNVPHALLLTGEKGSGKKTIALLFAKLLLCERHKEDPCLVCTSCRQVEAGDHPDVLMIGPEKNKKGDYTTISVKSIRTQITDAVSMRPYKGPYKIFIIDHAEKMTIEAQNALLKTLEEPPKYAVLILLASEADSLLETIRSRCAQFSLNDIAADRIQEYLQQEMKVPDYLARPAAGFAQGNLGKAVSLISDETFRDCYERVAEFFKNAQVMGYDRITEFAAEACRDAETCEMTIDLIQLMVRDCLLTKSGAKGQTLYFDDYREVIRKTSGKLTVDGLSAIEDKIFQTKQRLTENIAADIAVEDLLSMIREAIGR